MTEDSVRPGLARGPAAVVCVLAVLVVVVLAVLLVPWDWVPGGRLTPMPASDLFTPAQIARAEHYSSVQRWLSWASYFIALLVALALGFTPLGAKLVRRLAGRLRWWLTVPAGTLLLLVIGRLVTLPFALAERHRDLDYGLTNQGLAGWSSDYLKSLLVGWVTASIVLLIVVGFARWSPRYWFAWAGGAALILTFVGSFAYPVLVEPLFNTFTPMHDGPFKQSVFRLADREGVQINDVLVSDASQRTTTINAYVSGFGSTRRVVVYDNLLKDLTPSQARVVIAHELGHAKNDDVLIGTTLGAVGSVFAVALLALILDSSWVRWRAHVTGAADPAAVALLLAWAALGGFLVSPAQNTISRAIEARADRVSIQTTHHSKVFIEMQHRLAVTSLADPTPPAVSQFWWGSHPTALQRAGLPASLRAANQ
jgi:STE24 endopeptidase